jgi:hypothetical protein
MSNSVLTIAIPTFERAELLQNTLTKYNLLARDFFQYQIQILIVDNNSNDHTSKVVTSFQGLIPNLNYIKNDSNVGGALNIVKCFEVCESEWLWIIPDDCFPTKAGIDIIMKTLSVNRNMKLVVVGEIHSFENKSCITFDDCLTSNLLAKASWLPSVIYKMDASRLNIQVALDCVKFSYPHLGMFIVLLDSCKSCPIIYLNKVFESNNNHVITHKYSFISGAVIPFAEIIDFFFNNYQRKQILTQFKQYVHLNKVAFKLLIADVNSFNYKVILKLAKYYNSYYLYLLLIHFIWSNVPEMIRIRVLFFRTIVSGQNKPKDFEKFHNSYLVKKKYTRIKF